MISQSSAALRVFPPGAMVYYSGAWKDNGGTSAPVPYGWLRCDGSVKNQSDYPALYAAIGSFFNTGGEAGGTFRLPNVASTRRFIYGAANNTLPATVVTGGNDYHQHTWTNNITGATDDSGYHGHNVNAIYTGGGNAGGYHNSYNQGANSGGSNSNFTAGNGNAGGGGSIQGHTHYYVGYIDAADHYHNHNHNGTNAVYSGNLAHSLTFPNASQTGATYAVSLAGCISDLIIKT